MLPRFLYPKNTFKNALLNTFRGHNSFTIVTKTTFSNKVCSASLCKFNNGSGKADKTARPLFSIFVPAINAKTIPMDSIAPKSPADKVPELAEGPE